MPDVVKSLSNGSIRMNSTMNVTIRMTMAMARVAATALSRREDPLLVIAAPSSLENSSASWHSAARSGSWPKG